MALMSHNNYGLLRRCRGSILMETVLVIPLYLAFLSGVFWVGDLILIRSKLTVSDRVAAWGHGNRHQEMSSGDSKSFLKDRFFNDQAVGSNQQVHEVNVDRQTYGLWTRLERAAVALAASPPPWTDGWRRASMSFFAVDSHIDPVTFHSREIADPFMHQVLMRNKNDFRENSTPQSLAENISWYTQVYRDAWPEWADPNSSSALGGVSPCLQYQRFNSYVQWSE